FVLAEIDPFAIGAVAGDAKLNPEETAARGRSDIYIDHAITHFKIVQHGRSPIEEEALTALIVSRPGLPLQVPPLRIRGNREHLRRLRAGLGPQKNCAKSAKGYVSKHGWPPKGTRAKRPHPRKVLIASSSAVQRRETRPLR